MLAHVGANYVALILLCNARPAARPWLLGAIAVTNVAVLFGFKYLGFFEGVIRGQAVANPVLAPLGISFYTFHMVSLAVDLRDEDPRAVPSPLDYMLYVTFWPQLIAGPITRGDEILPQLQRQPHVTAKRFWQGAILITVGLFYKSVLTDALAAPIATKVFGHTGPVSSADAWAGASAFAVQIYGDFFGYTSCAIGAALCLGYDLPRNFMAPYRAAGFSDFWRRWHISLSRWIRDYVYRPLGGDRSGRTSINLLATMTLAGLWHGAGWTFILWGAAHGLLLTIERHTPRLNALRKTALDFTRGTAASPPAWWIALTFLIVVALWVPFRASSIASIWMLWGAMIWPGVAGPTVLPIGDVFTGIGLAAALFAVHVLLPRGEADALLAANPHAQAVIATFLLALVIAVPAEQQPFIYFQF